MSLVAKNTHFGMGDVHFGRTAAHFVNIIIFKWFWGDNVHFMPISKKNVCDPKVSVPFRLLIHWFEVLLVTPQRCGAHTRYT